MRPTLRSAPANLLSNDSGITPRSQARVSTDPKEGIEHTTVSDEDKGSSTKPAGGGWWPGTEDEADEEEDPDREVRDRQEQEWETIFIGYGRVGFYNPMSYFSLPFRQEGTILPKILPVMIAAIK